MAKTNEHTTVHLLRHGEVYNPDGVLYGRLPGFFLSDLGHEMAERAAVALADRDIATVISSPMERAQQTATPIAGRHNLDIVTNADLIEADKYEAEELFACNATCPNGKDVIIQAGCVTVNAELRRRGFIVHEVSTEEFLKSGGSVFCMKMMVW